MSDPADESAELSPATAVALASSAIAARGGQAQHCTNCLAPLIGPFCAACGQPHDTSRKSVRRLLGEAFGHLVKFDSRLMRTIFALLLQPGQLPLAFKAGQTQRYVPAPRLYLFVSLLFFVILSVSGIALFQLEVNASRDARIQAALQGTGSLGAPLKAAPVLPPLNQRDVLALESKAQAGKLSGADVERLRNALDVTTRGHFFERLGTVRSHIPALQREELRLLEVNVQAQAAIDSRIRWLAAHAVKAFDDIADDPAALNAPLSIWIPRMLFLLLPLFAGLLWLFYWRQRREFLLVDHLIFSLTLHTFLFVVLMLAAFAVQIVPAGIVGGSAQAIVAVYFFVAVKRFYRQSYFWTALKAVSIAFIYTYLILWPALFVVVAASVLQA